MKNKILAIFGTAFVGWFIYGIFSSWAGIMGGPFDWIETIKIFLPLAVLATIIAYAVKGRPETTNVIPRKLIAFYILTIAVLFWVISPLEDFFLLSITGRDLAVDVFFYLWEAIILGGGAIMIFMHLFRPVTAFLKNYQSNIKDIDKGEVIGVSRLVSRFPLLTAAIASFLNAGGYVIGAAGFVFFRPDIEATVVINNLMTGIAVGQIVFVVFYFFTRNILEDVNRVLYVFGDITSPQRIVGITGKVFLPGISSMVFLAATTIVPIVGLVSNSPDSLFFYTVILINFVMSLLMLILIGSAVATDLTRSTEEIKHGIDLIQSDNWSHRINIKTGDEMEDVAYLFNKTTTKVGKDIK